MYTGSNKVVIQPVYHYLWREGPIDSHQMDVKSLIQGMLSLSKADVWVVMLYTNYLLAGMNFVKCVCKMEKDH